MTFQRIEELYALADNFSKISGATVAIFDSNCKIIAFSQPCAPFCSAIREIPIINKQCMECDVMGFTKCAATKKPYLYHCHMGLVEISAPIMLGETLLGYILIGQFMDTPDNSSVRETVISLSEKYHFSSEKALQKLDEVVFLSAEYTSALTQVIEMCANYIWLKNIMELNDSNLAYEIKLYISEHLTEDLSVGSLCSKYGLSATALYQLLKKTFGCGIAQIIREERIKRAAEFLLDPSFSVGDIASLVGIPITLPGFLRQKPASRQNFSGKDLSNRRKIKAQNKFSELPAC